MLREYLHHECASMSTWKSGGGWRVWEKDGQVGNTVWACWLGKLSHGVQLNSDVPRTLEIIAVTSFTFRRWFREHFNALSKPEAGPNCSPLKEGEKG